MRPGTKLPHEIDILERSESGLPELVESTGYVPPEISEITKEEE